MDKRTQGAWLLAHSKNLDHVSGAGALRLENIAYAGRIGRLYNILRRGSDERKATTINADVVNKLCQLNDIGVASRRDGLQVLKETGRIDVGADGSVAVLGATSIAILEVASDVFAGVNASSEEHAVLHLSDSVSDRPLARSSAEQLIGDTFKIKAADTSGLVDLCKETALIDEEAAGEKAILFNSNTFRDKERAKKAYYILQGLNATDANLLREVEEQLRSNGAMLAEDVEKVIGKPLFGRLSSVGYFDRMEVNNPSETVTYVALPDAFQRFGRPFEEDPVDDAKALLASLTYGMTRSASGRGRIDFPHALINALVAGREIGGEYGATAIGQDYRELERRGTVQLRHVSGSRYRMKLLKPDVGQLAQAIVSGGGRPSEEALLLGQGAATGFKGPDAARKAVRVKNNAEDRRFVLNVLDEIRSGG